MCNIAKKAIVMFLNSFRKLQLKGGTDQIDGMIVGNTQKRSIVKRLQCILGSYRSGCKVELCNSPTNKTMSPLMLEYIEILTNIILLKEAMKAIAMDVEIDCHPALVYHSWQRLQVQALFNRLDEIKEIEHGGIIY